MDQLRRNLTSYLVAGSLLAVPMTSSADETYSVSTDDIDKAEGGDSQPDPIDPAADRYERTKAPEVDLAKVTSDSLVAAEQTYEEPTFEYETTRRTYPNVPLLVTSTTVFAAGYVPAIVGAALSDRGDDDLYIPVAGPWLTYKNGPDETGGQKTLLIVNGATQMVGALGMLSSFFVPQSRTSNWYLIGNSSFHVTPAGTGLLASGTF